MKKDFSISQIRSNLNLLLILLSFAVVERLTKYCTITVYHKHKYVDMYGYLQDSVQHAILKKC